MAKESADLDLSTITLETIFDAWRLRLEVCSSARMKIDFHVNERTSYDDELGELQEGVSLPDFIDYDYTWEISIQGRKTRYSITGDRILEADGKIHSSDMAAAFDGEWSTFLAQPHFRHDFPSGHIFDLDQAESFVVSSNFPVRWTFAPFESSLQEHPFAECTLSPEHPVKDGQPHVAIELESSGSYVRRSFWLNPSQGFSISRYNILLDGVLTRQLDCGYELIEVDSGTVWIPKQWTEVHFDVSSGEPFFTKQAIVQRLELNPDFADAEWIIEFPVGTVVQTTRPDPTVGRIGRTGTLNYLMMENGEKMPITMADANRSYQDLLTGKGKSAPSKNSTTGYRFALLIVNVLAVVAVVAWFVWRHKNREAANS